MAKASGTIDLKSIKDAHDDAETRAVGYITDVDNSGISVHPLNNTNNRTVINASGMEIFKGNISVASFSDTLRLGQTNKSRQELDYHSMQLIDKEGNQYLYISDLRDTSGETTWTTVHTVTQNESLSKVFYLDLEAKDTSYNVTVSNGTGGTVTKTTTSVTFQTTITVGATITIGPYATTDVRAKAYTLGKRTNNSVIGPLSFANGWNNVASGVYSHAEGYNVEATHRCNHAEGEWTKAYGMNSHAEGVLTTASGDGAHSEGSGTTASGFVSHSEGYNTTASGVYSHAEGSGTVASVIGSHAEGYNTTASGICSHAEGDDTTAAGDDSHAGGQHSTANGNISFAHGNTVQTTGQGGVAFCSNTKAGYYQTAIGRWNSGAATSEQYSNSDYAFMVGNGTAENSRSNAFAVTWGGNAYINNKLVSDFIIEQGKNTGTGQEETYRIWASGKKEVFGYATVTCNSMAAFGSSGLYHGGFNLVILKTGFFTTRDTWQFMVRSTGGSGYATVWSTFAASNINTFTMRIVGTAAGAGSVVINYHIIGT